MDKYGIDDHKLHYHVQRVNKWLNGEIIAPIYMEISPSGACNHRCVFCALDFMKYKPVFLETVQLKTRLSELAKIGLKSVMFAGEGEPLLHKDTCEIANHCAKEHLDIAFTTNGVLLAEEIIEQLLPVTSWIKVSCNAGTAKTYAGLHRCPENDFETVFNNLERAVQIRTAKNVTCTLGLQMLLLPENCNEVMELALRCKDIGLDYLVIKPYSQHPDSKTTRYKEIVYSDLSPTLEKVMEISSDTFTVIHRKTSMDNWDMQQHAYDNCLALPFWSYLDANGNIHGCSMHMKNEHFYYGNIYEESIEAIWFGEKRRRSLEWVDKHLDPQSCRVNCRMDKINRYLWALNNPPAHKNFI